MQVTFLEKVIFFLIIFLSVFATMSAIITFTKEVQEIGAESCK